MFLEQNTEVDSFNGLLLTIAENVRQREKKKDCSYMTQCSSRYSFQA